MNPITEARETLGLSKTQFASKVGVSRSYISKLENGKSKISDSILYKVARISPDVALIISKHINLNICEGTYGGFVVYKF